MYLEVIITETLLEEKRSPYQKIVTLSRTEKYVLNPEQHTMYKLTSAGCHIGSLDKGHCYSMINKNSVTVDNVECKDVWFNAHDDVIDPLNKYYLPGGQITQTLILVFLAPKSESRNVHKSHTGDLPPATF
jgi:hypothetical protein